MKRLGSVLSKCIEYAVGFLTNHEAWDFIGRLVLFILPLVAIIMLVKVLIDNYKE